MFISITKFGGIFLSKKKLVIFDKDERYAANLLEYLGSLDNFPYMISAFTEKEAFKKSFAGQKVDLLLASESSYAEIKEFAEAEQTMILNESGTLTWNDLQNIQKYQTAENIVREIMQYYVEVAQIVPSMMTLTETVKIIGFFSPVRRCLQTTMGLTLGQIMAEKYKTLYINFESLSGFPYMLGYSEGKDLSDLLYCSEIMPEKFGIHLKSCVKKLDNLEYIPPMNAMHQMLLVTSEKWRKMLQMIVRTGEYQVLVLDLSEGMQGLFDILRMCTHVYTLTKDDKYACAKLEQYERLLKICEYDDVLNKTFKRKIPIMHEIPNGFFYQPGGEYSRFIKNMLKEDGVYV